MKEMMLIDAVSMTSFFVTWSILNSSILWMVSYGFHSTSYSFFAGGLFAVYSSHLSHQLLPVDPRGSRSVSHQSLLTSPSNRFVRRKTMENPWWGF